MRSTLKKASRNIIAHALRPENANALKGAFGAVRQGAADSKRDQTLRASMPKMKYGKSATTAWSWKAAGKCFSAHATPTPAASATQSVRVLSRHRSGATARTPNIAYANQ